MQYLASEFYETQTVGDRLKKMSNKAVKVGAELSKEEISRGSDQGIHQVNIPDGRALRTSNHMCEALQQHFQDGFIKEPTIYEQEFHIDFPPLSSNESASS